MRKTSENIHWHKAAMTRARREEQNGHKSAAIWFTGLSASGKSTLAHAIEERLYEAGCRSYVFDGDNVRHGLNRDLGFSPEDRKENIRRIGEMVKLFLDAGVIAVTAFISPYRADRDWVRSLVGDEDFIEVYCDCGIEVCEGRDTKGIYKKARAGLIPEFTGVSAPYEPPERPEIRLDTAGRAVEACVETVMDYLRRRGVIPGARP
jgi:adenylylsulfate kinase